MANQKDIVDAVAQALQTKDLSQQAVGIIHRSTEKVLKRVQQDVSAGIKEDADGVTEEFCRNLATKLGTMSQTWYDNVRQELMVYPEGTRFIQKTGETTVIVIEQATQVRTVNIKGKFYHLSMPYVIFMTSFTNGVWNRLVLAGALQKPMTSLNDQLLCLPLPNVSGHSVCMGNFAPTANRNMTEQVGEIISSFWQSVFNDSAFEAPAAIYDKWAKRTKEDPLCALHDQLKTGDTVSVAVGKFPNRNSQPVDIVNALKTEIVTAVGNIGANIQNTLLSVDVVKQNKQKVSIETLDEVLKEIIVQAYAELWEYLQSQLQRERAKMQQEMASLLKTRSLTENKW